MGIEKKIMQDPPMDLRCKATFIIEKSEPTKEDPAIAALVFECNLCGFDGIIGASGQDIHEAEYSAKIGFLQLIKENCPKLTN